MAFRFILNELFDFHDGKKLRPIVIEGNEGFLGLYDPLNPLEYE